jgi:hypothetical protein
MGGNVMDDRITEQHDQRQDSLRDQLADLRAIAVRLGMCDAVDYLDRVIGPP